MFNLVESTVLEVSQAQARLTVALVGGDEQASDMAAALVRGGRDAATASRIALNNHADRLAGVACHAQRGACDGCRAAYNHIYTGERPKVCGCLCHNEAGDERGSL